MNVVFPTTPLKPLILEKKPIIFLAGSIEMGRAENWQDRVCEDLKHEQCIILNPRRKDWDSSWKQERSNQQFYQQVRWELSGLRLANFIAMYFVPETQSPISLLELGLHATKDTLVFCPNGFWRKGNVDIVCEEYGIPQARSYCDFVAKLKCRIREWTDFHYSRAGLT